MLLSNDKIAGAVEHLSRRARNAKGIELSRGNLNNLEIVLIDRHPANITHVFGADASAASAQPKVAAQTRRANGNTPTQAEIGVEQLWTVGSLVCCQVGYNVACGFL